MSVFAELPHSNLGRKKTDKYFRELEFRLVVLNVNDPENGLIEAVTFLSLAGKRRKPREAFIAPRRADQSGRSPIAPNQANWNNSAGRTSETFLTPSTDRTETDIDASRSSMIRNHAPDPQPLVGREFEMERLLVVAEDALAGNGRVVLCIGEAGSGKTRLAQELKERIETKHVPCLWGRALESESMSPFSVWRQITGQLVSTSEPLRDENANIEVITHWLAGSVAHESLEERLRVFDSITELLRNRASTAGLALMIDDLHWMDQASLQLLLHLASRISNARMLIMATTRHPTSESSEHVMVKEELRSEPLTATVELAPLSNEASVALVESILGDRVPADRTQAIVSRAAGNPFILRELALASLDQEQLGVPTTVRDAIRSRLRHVGQFELNVLRAAAVLGGEFSAGIVATMTGEAALRCMDVLDDGVLGGFVEPSEAPGQYQFLHTILRDSIYADIPIIDRVRLHRLAAEAIESYYAGRLRPHVSALAVHWSIAAVAGERRKAADWAVAAAREAMQQLAFENAVKLFQMSLDVGGPEVEGIDLAELFIDLAAANCAAAKLDACMQACSHAVEIGRRGGRGDLIGRAALVTEGVGDPSISGVVRAWCEEALSTMGAQHVGLRARVLAMKAHCALYLGDQAGLAEASKASLQEAEHSGDDHALAAALMARQLAAAGPSGLEEREKISRRLLDVSRTTGLSDERWARSWMIDALMERGDLVAAAEETDSLEHCVERLGYPLARWNLLRTRATLAQAHADFADARNLGEEALRVVDPKTHPPAIGAYSALMLATCHHTEYGPEVLEHFSRAARREQPTRFGLISLLGLALAQLESGHPAEAAAEYARLGSVESWKPPPFLAMPLYALAMLVAAGLGRADHTRLLDEALAEFSDRHVVSGLGAVNYLGPVSMYLGIAARVARDFDSSVAFLEDALGVVDANGARGFGVEIRCELAETLLARGMESDSERAVAVAREAGPTAKVLGMKPFVYRATAIARRGKGAQTLLSSRELEVAALVAEGLTNPQIAQRLVLSERTAQNHVQHILTKLGFTNRSQVAAWWASRHEIE